MKNIILKLKKAIKNPSRVFLYFLSKEYVARCFTDKAYLKVKYRLAMKKKLDLKSPKTFNEKLQWLKLYDKKPEYTRMVDKYLVRDYIKEKIGEEYLIPLLGVWDNFDDIDFDSLPNKFVLKCTHDSGGLVICKDKSKLDIREAKKKINRCLKRNYFWENREWPYKNVKPRIIAEKYMVDESGNELKDYKIFCFNGKPEYVEVDFNRFVEHRLNPYDFNWKPLGFCDSSKNDYSAEIAKPKKLEEMREIAKVLSKEIAFVRVDFYSIYSKIYIGEITLYPGSGYIHFEPDSVDLKYGKLLNLKGIKKNENF